MLKFNYCDGVKVKIASTKKIKFATILSGESDVISVEINSFEVYCTYHTCDAGVVILTNDKIDKIEDIALDKIIAAFYLAYSSEGVTYLARTVDSNLKMPYAFECPGKNTLHISSGIKYTIHESSKLIGMINQDVNFPEKWINNGRLITTENKIPHKTFLSLLLPDSKNGNVKTCVSYDMIEEISLLWGYQLNMLEENIGDITIIDENKFDKLTCDEDDNTITSYEYFSISYSDYIFTNDKGRYLYDVTPKTERHFYGQKVVSFKYSDSLKSRYNISTNLFIDKTNSIKPHCIYKLIEKDGVSVKFEFDKTVTQIEKKSNSAISNPAILSIKSKDFHNEKNETEVAIKCTVKPTTNIVKDYYFDDTIKPYSIKYNPKKNKEIFESKNYDYKYKFQINNFTIYGLYLCDGDFVGEGNGPKIDDKEYLAVVPQNKEEFERLPNVYSNGEVETSCIYEYKDFGELTMMAISNNDKRQEIIVKKDFVSKYFSYDEKKNEVKYTKTISVNDYITCQYKTHFNTTFNVKLVYTKEIVEKIKNNNQYVEKDSVLFIVACSGAALLIIFVTIGGFCIVRKRRNKRLGLHNSSIGGSSSNNSSSMLSSRFNSSNFSGSGVRQSYSNSSNVNRSSISKTRSKTKSKVGSISKKKSNFSTSISKSNRTKVKTVSGKN
uniref:Ig-like domain-containing protein n=1 Tax=Parastrongyloides trichosuri TaxID=131310 RepID=A0A0N4ZQE5_PARTI